MLLVLQPMAWIEPKCSTVKWQAVVPKCITAQPKSKRRKTFYLTIFSVKAVDSPSDKGSHE